MRGFIKALGLVTALLTLPVMADSLEGIVSQLPEQEAVRMHWEKSKFPQGFEDGFLLIDCGESDKCIFRFIGEISLAYRLLAVQEEKDHYRIAVLPMEDELRWTYSVAPKLTTYLHEGSQFYRVYSKPVDETKCEGEMIDGEEVWTCKEDLKSNMKRVFPGVSETGLCYNGYGVVPLEKC